MRLAVLALGLAIVAMPAPPAAARCRAHHCLWHGLRHAHWHLRTPLRMGWHWHRYRYHQVAYHQVARARRERPHWYAVVTWPSQREEEGQGKREAGQQSAGPTPPPGPAPAWQPDPMGWPDAWLERGDSPARWRPELRGGN